MDLIAYNASMKVVLAPILVLVSGCAAVPVQPIDVTLIPNDCANQRAIVAYLEAASSMPKSGFVSQQQYDQHVSSTKNRMWSLRYHCNRR